jgi:hypothetical protein
VGLSVGARSIESDEEEEDEEDDESEGEPVELDEESEVPLAAVSASTCMVPIRANIPAAAASVTAAATAAVRRVPLRTAAAAPHSLPVIGCSPPNDALSRHTFGEQPDRSL